MLFRSTRPDPDSCDGEAFQDVLLLSTRPRRVDSTRSNAGPVKHYVQHPPSTPPPRPRSSRVPSARQGRSLKQQLLNVSLISYTVTRAWRAGNEIDLPSKQDRLWSTIDGLKRVLRDPPNAQRRVNTNLPLWEQWTTLFLDPPPSFQKARTSARRC